MSRAATPTSQVARPMELAFPLLVAGVLPLALVPVPQLRRLAVFLSVVLVLAAAIRWSYEGPRRKFVEEFGQEAARPRGYSLGVAISLVVMLLFAAFGAFVLSLGLAFGHREPGDSGTALSVMGFAYPITVLATLMASLVLYARNRPGVYMLPLGAAVVAFGFGASLAGI